MQPDIPADLRTTDAFGHEDYAVAAGAVLLAAQAPFTLGIFGDWGIGKTTIVHGVRDVVLRGGVAYVEFDVWRYEDDAFRRQFLREVASQLGAAKQLHRWGWRRRWKEYDPAIELRDLEADVPVPDERLRFSLRALVAAAIHFGVIFLPLWWFLHSSLPRDLWGRTRIPSSSADVAAAVVAGIGFLYTLVNRILRVDQRYVTIRRIEEPERFEEKFRTLLRLTKAKRVVIAIDDLDRCKPELVDKFLAMLKTYLEPVALEDGKDKSASASKSADAVFLISADEAAVRRHMIARELASQPRLAFGDDAAARLEQEQEQLRQAEYQVDEYLRKFFNAVIRVRPLLPEDVRSFTRGQLGEFFAEHMKPGGREGASADGEKTGLPLEDERERLIAMVAGALRKNPRRIKQFVHNLDARIRTIKQREASGRIAAGISDDVLGIAKIAIIEEEWRDEYDKLESNPRLLAEWQAKATEAGLPNNRALTSFLQFNRDIVPWNVQAVVNLKLEKDDLTLPEFGEFRDAVAYGDFRTAREVIASAPVDAAGEYSARLPELLSRELGRDGFVEARNIIDAALQDPPLGLSDDEAQNRMISDALAHAQVVLQFLTLDPARLFTVFDRLNEGERRKGRRPFLNLQAMPSGSQNLDGVRRLCEELATRTDQLDDDEKRLLEQSIAQSQHLRSAWLPLVEAEPDLLTEGAIHDVFQALLGAAVEPDSSEFRVGLIGMSRGIGQQFYEQYINRLRDFLPTVMGELSRVKPYLLAVTATLSHMSIALDPAMQSLLTTIRSNGASMVDQVGVEGVEGLLRVSSTADHLTAISATTAAAEAEQIAQDLIARYPDAVARVLISDPSTLSGQPLAVVRAGLQSNVQSMSPGTPSWPVIVDALMAIGDGDTMALVHEALSRHVAAGLVAEAANGLEQLVVGPNGAEVAAWLQTDSNDDLLPALGNELDSRLLTQLDGADYDPRFLPAVNYLASRWGVLTQATRGILSRSATRWLDATPAVSAAIGPPLSALAGARVAEKGSIVRAFARAARAGPDRSVREAALTAAARISGDSQTLARTWRPTLEEWEQSKDLDLSASADAVREALSSLS